MPIQEFLASYAVEVDESGAKRLQEVLQSNREMAETLAGAFDAARSALGSLSSDLGSFDPQSLLSEALLTDPLPKAEIPAELDLSEAEASAESYSARLESIRPKLKVNTTGITSAVSGAVSSIRAMLASVNISVPVTAVATLDTSGLPTESGGSSSSSTPQRAGASGTQASAGAASVPPVPALGKGGRVEAPTFAIIGEEKEPEYVIPVNREEQAIPLLRDLLAELSEKGREMLFSNSQLQGENPVTVSGLPDRTLIPERTAPEAAWNPDLSFLSASLARLTDLAALAAVPAAAQPPAANNSVEAPVTINVTAAESRPEEIGRSVYDLAQRYLLRTMKGVFT